MRIDRAALSCSLILVALLASGQSYRELRDAVRAAPSEARKREILRSSELEDEALAQATERGVKEATEYLELATAAEGAARVNPPADRIRAIKSSPVYRDEGERETSNWLAGAVERLKNIRLRLPQSGMRAPTAPNPGGFAALLVYFVWFLLAAGVLAFILFALRLVSLGKLKTRRARALLEEDEPERTLDEWLAQADALEREGRYREAVRALYLACLLKIDERNVARFVRGQTNWEHLARIEASARRPRSLEFRPPTEAFDRVWYGHKVRGAADVSEFRAWYLAITEALSGVAA